MRRAIAAVAVLTVLVWASPAQQGQDKKDTKDEPTALEKQLLELVNKEREKEKLPPLKFNAALYRAARDHSANMAKKNELNHVLDGKTPDKRIAEAGYEFGTFAENIAWGDGQTPAEVVQGWMESPRHKANILNKDMTETGLGAVRGSGRELWYTEVFARPRRR
jgi:uncharacterized protein YkwD